LTSPGFFRGAEECVSESGAGRRHRRQSLVVPDLFALHSDCATQVDASFHAAIRSPANGISGVCAPGFSRLPRRKRLTRLLLPPPLAAPATPLATFAYAARSTPRSRMHQPGWRNSLE